MAEFSQGASKRPVGETECERSIPMRRQGAKLVAVTIFAGAALIASCAKPYHEETERYVFLATNINLPYWREAQAGFLDAAKTLGVKGELTGPTTYDPNGEVGMFRQIVEQHPAGICVSAARPEIFQADIDKAVAEGIPVICVDADVPNSKRLLYIGTDNFKAGRESLKRMAALVPGQGSIVVITIPGQHNLDDLHHNAVHQFKDWRSALATPMPTNVDTGTVVVDKNNIKVYREALAAHPEPL